MRGELWSGGWLRVPLPHKDSLALPAEFVGAALRDVIGTSEPFRGDFTLVSNNGEWQAIG